LLEHASPTEDARAGATPLFRGVALERLDLRAELGENLVLGSELGGIVRISVAASGIGPGLRKKWRGRVAWSGRPAIRLV
jgi:hypothetical protein